MDPHTHLGSGGLFCEMLDSDMVAALLVRLGDQDEDVRWSVLDFITSLTVQGLFSFQTHARSKC